MQTTTTETPALTLDRNGSKQPTLTASSPLGLESTELTQADYRALREGREIPKAVETESSAADAQTAEAETAVAAETTEPNSEGTKQEPKPKADKLSGRFSELTAKIRALETQLAAKSGALPAEKTESKAAVEPPTITPDPNDPEPDASKFENYTDWQKAWNRWDRRQETRAEQAARVVAEQKTAAATKADAWQTRVKEAAKEMSDFAEVAQNPDLPVTREMGEAILESELGPKILYHLGQNPDEAARIAKLSPVSQVREIGKLERALEASAAEETPAATPSPKATTVSKAPAPHRPVGGAAAANPAKNLDTMTQAEYRAYRESGKIR